MQFITGIKTTSLVGVFLAALSISAIYLDAAGVKPTAKEPNVNWSLAGREGECASLSLLKKKYPELGDVKSPYQLAEKLKADGAKAEVKEYSLGNRPSVEVRVPAKNLYVMFIRTDLCKRAAPAGK